MAIDYLHIILKKRV